jgi:dihydroorotate dehydrogenase electron transfer subunit
MTNPLHASFHADEAIQRTVEITQNVRVAQDTFRLRFECPEIAERITPGQFLMLRLAEFDDPLIGRPLALYDTIEDIYGNPFAIDVVYLVKGKFTTRLAKFLPGQSVDVWGPLGNGFPAESVEHLIMVAGGIGQTPFLALGQEFLGTRHYGQPARQPASTSEVTLCYGARTAELLAGVDDFERAGFDVRIATDDGSRGHHGFVTELLEQTLDETSLQHRVVCCGPEPMMEAVASVAQKRGASCQVSLETPMACGVGICFTCVAKVKDETGNWDFKRTCVEGPVFDAAKIVW